MRLDLLLRSTTTPQQGWRLLGYTDGGGGSVIWGPGWEGGGDDYIRAGYGQGEGWDDNHYADKPVTIHRRVWRLCVARGQGGACEQMRARHTLYLYLCRDENTTPANECAGGGFESVFVRCFGVLANVDRGA